MCIIGFIVHCVKSKIRSVLMRFPLWRVMNQVLSITVQKEGRKISSPVLRARWGNSKAILLRKTKSISVLCHNLLDHESFGGANPKPHDRLRVVFSLHLTQCGNKDKVVSCAQIAQKDNWIRSLTVLNKVKTYIYSCKNSLVSKPTTPKAAPDNLNPVTLLTQDKQTSAHPLDRL